MNRVLIAAGGTGGHVFPALAIAEEIKEQWPETEILFVGTKRGLEDRVIPKAGFKLKTITMSGFSRGFSISDVWQNLKMPFKVLAGFMQSLSILRSFKPKAIVGCGGYVTGPILLLGAVSGRKTFLQEQNSRPGKTTIFLSRFATEVHLTYEEARRFLKRQTNVKITGNPLRKSLKRIPRTEARVKMNLDPNKQTVLIIGGSLGARSINSAMTKIVRELVDRHGIQLIWQTGKLDHAAMSVYASSSVLVTDFVDDMSVAYSAADLIVCRAGAMTLSEIAMMGLPGILVPYPFAAENHQEYNAKSLVDREAAIMIQDIELDDKLGKELSALLTEPDRIKTMSKRALSLSRPNAARDFVKSMEASFIANRH